MATFDLEPLTVGLAEADVAMVPWVPIDVPSSAYIEYRDQKPIGQLWPRGGLPEGAGPGPQVT